MASPYSAWTDSFSCLYPSLSRSARFSEGGLPSADPTETDADANASANAQPVTSSKNVSDFVVSDVYTTHPQPSTTGMARKRHYSQQAAPLAPPPRPVQHDDPSSHTAHAHNAPDFACNVAEHCHFSPPCDKPDCDESTICFDHNAHDYLPCNNHLTWCQERSKCDDVYACEGDACNLDFDCLFPCPDICDEADCHQPQHAQGCNTICATVACSDPQCNEGVLYCCLSDICPHKAHTDCHQPCPPNCQISHTHCNAPIPPACLQPCSAVDAPSLPACLQPCNLTSHTPCPASLPDNMSTSTISTPHTDLSDSLQTPTNLHFQSLVEAAATQAMLSASNPGLWGDYPSFDDNFAPQRKRRRVDGKSTEQKLYESNVMDQTFMKSEQSFQDPWQDYAMNFSADFMLQNADLVNANAASSQSSSQPKIRPPPAPSASPEDLVCRWEEETTGPCNVSFTSSEDFHNHVKEHTSTLVGIRGANRDYKCRWAGCDKIDPFGTKNHLDRHMQNHTGFKPFSCSICGHRCVTHQQLTNHLTTHTRSKPFVCDHPGCSKSFSVKTALSTHKRTHTNDKPFACRFCGDKYADSSNLSKHRKTVHEDERTSIPCPEPGCVYRDSRCQRLERHCRDCGHGAELYADPMRWAEYTGRWKRKTVGGNGRSRTGSVARSSISVA